MTRLRKMMLEELGRNVWECRPDFLVGLGERNTFTQSCHHVKKMRRAVYLIRVHGAMQLNWHPRLIFGRRELEAARHHPDNRIWQAVHRGHLANHVAAPAEAALPQTITQHHHAVIAC